MSNALINLSMSLDGYIAAQNESRDAPLGEGGAVLHHWMLKGDTMLTEHIDPLYHGFFNASGSNAKVMTGLFGELGAMVFGRRTYDLVQGWGGTYPIPGIPVFVVTRNPPDAPPDGRSEILFVSTVSEAIAYARTAAGGKGVGIAGGKIGMSCLAAGLVDEIYLHTVPVVLGGGVWFAAHKAFHLALYAGAGRRLYRLIAQQLDATVRYLRLENAILDVAEQDLREHRALLDAAKAWDGERAAEIIRCHVGETGEVLAARHYNRSGGDVP